MSEQDYLSSIRELIKSEMIDVNTSINGEVVSYANGFATIRPLAKFFKFNFDMLGVNVPTGMSAGKVASASGGGAGGVSNSVTIHQTLPAGTPEETKVAAREGAKKAIYDKIMMDRIARQAGQAQ